MANIVPSNDRTELACQLYFLRAILGNLYSDATELDKKSARIEKLETVLGFMRIIFCHLGICMEVNYDTYFSPEISNLKKKYTISSFVSLFFSILSTVVILLLFYFFANSVLYLAIIIGVFITLFGIGYTIRQLNRVNLLKRGPEIESCECGEFDTYYPITIELIKGKIEPKDVEYPELYNIWLEEINGITRSLDDIIKECNEFTKSHADYVNKQKSNEESIVNRYCILERKIQIVHNTLQKEKDEYQIELNKFMEKKAYVASQFFGFLIEDDWRMIDDLIYMVVSGRATTMQEALNYGDLKLRHEETIKALNTVAQILNEQMIVQKQLLQATLNAVAGIYALSDKLDDLKTVIVASAASVNKTIKASSKAMCQSIGQVKQSIQ